jgi:argininosuccinate lyase
MSENGKSNQQSDHHQSQQEAARQSGHLEVGARLKAAPDEALLNTAFAHEVRDGPLLYRAMSFADLAYVVMLCEENLIPPASRPSLLQGLLHLHNIPPEQFPFSPIFGDIYTNRENALRQHTGADSGADGWLRMGRARRESSTVGYTLVTRDGLLGLMQALLGLLETLLNLAEAHRETLMPDYTYLQKAHPTTLGHYLLTFAMPISRDLSRLRAVYDRFDQCPAGIGSVNGARLPLNRNRLAELLAFQGVAEHTRDAMWQADVAIEAAMVAVAALVNADRLAEDLYIFATEEFGYLTLSDAFSRASVIMPQKKNPYALAYVRGAARQAIGTAQTVIATNLTPSGQPDNRIFAYGDIPRLLDSASRVVVLLAKCLSGATFHTARMAQRAGEGFSGATDLGDYLSEAAGLDPRTAHRVIGLAIRQMGEAGAAEPYVSPSALDAAAQQLLAQPLNLSPEKVLAVQQPKEILASRQGLGGAAPARVDAMIVNLRTACLGLVSPWVVGRQTAIAEAQYGLVALASALING